ncbi:acetate--CoA ligase family protein [Mesorhizobium sp.]|uniref:acetate--CoA ligase family protein n=1 Tax=Mesorhizobium sp. TaxID=1871066 RepID=UPI000FE96EA4|nr:acetate--CoA ligase family protein [Mesorhizobium sp.]RWI99858.1 MAG: CoA-binding protein [Mesorhizobium sp.]TIP94996.1 MAG: acetate--CoA ligase family protein [Mesorhizobium sp.]
MTHRLSPMFEARSMVVVGASAKAGSFGARLATSTLSREFAGPISFVNPRGGEIMGREALTAIRDLDYAPDVAVLGVGRANLERALIEAIEKNARSAVIFDTCHGEAADGSPILTRLRAIAAEAGIPVCGGSGMGFINTRSGAVASFYPAGHLTPGGISLIAHSGSVFTVLGMNDPRYRFDLMVSPGQEIGATIDEYIAYAATRETTRTIAVFMEAARNPQGLVNSLHLARSRDIPVVVCKVGRTEESARLARSHTGALAGSNAAYEAVFEECGAIMVDTIDDLMNTALLCSTGRKPRPGGVGLVTDSGGLRELQVDLASEMRTPLAVLSEATREALRAALPQELEPSNPLDCATDLTDDFPKVFELGLGILAAAPEVSMLGLEADFRDDYIYQEGVFALAKALPELTAKPCFVYTSFGQANNRRLGNELADLGVPCLNGAEATMAAVRRFQAWADQSDETAAPPIDGPDEAMLARWSAKLSGPMDEFASLDLLHAFGIKTAQSLICEDVAELQEAADQLGFPLVLKTAAGIDHKSDAGGVVLNLRDLKALEASYADLSRRLGSRVIVQKMAEKGIELAFGCVMDPDFGPLIMVSPGGTLVELFDERRFARAPFGPGKAEAMIRGLKVARLIDGVRGDAPRDMRAAAHALSAFSRLCAGLRTRIAEIDVNPVMVTESGAIAVDALIVPAAVLSKKVA